MLVHGFGVSGRYLLPTARLLAARRRVLVPDLPGFGRSPSGRPPLELAGLAQVLANWLDTLGINRVPLLGNSFGCQILLELACRRPQRVSALVLVGPTIDPTARSAGRQLARLLADSLIEPPGVWALIAIDYSRFLARGGWRVVRSMLRDRVEEKLPHIESPTLVVRGSRDRIVPQEWAERVASTLPDGELHVIKGAPHAANYAAPEELANAVESFLSPERGTQRAPF